MIYLDHAATTPCRAEAVAAMLPYLESHFGNPSSVHIAGQAAREGLDRSRDRVARALNARPEEIIFTSGGTEADNLALFGCFLQHRGRRQHLITASTEHHAVLHTAEWLRELGAEVTVLDVDGEGRVDPEAVRSAIRPDTFLVSIMAANNEIGTLAPITEIGEVCREAGIPFHTDAVQWVGAMPVDVRSLPVDFLTLTAHKFYGPKGAGVLFARRGVRFQPTVRGGSQERGKRAGTENVAAIVGLAEALDLVQQEQEQESVRQTELRDYLIASVLESIPIARLNGPRAGRLPNNAHFSFPGIESDIMVLNLDLEGIAASSGSACAAGAIEPSHVVKAIGLDHEHAVSALRLSLGRSTTRGEIDQTVNALQRIVQRLTG